MNPNVLVALPILAFAGALMLIVPHFSPRRFFFAVTVAPGFAASGPGRRIARFYSLGVSVDVAIAAALVFALAAAGLKEGTILAVALLVPAAGGLVQFVLARRRARQYAVSVGTREADLAAAEEGLPRWTALALIPFAGPLAAALYLRAHWQEIPQRIPVHFSLNGTPDRWVDKTAGAVYGVAAANAGLLLCLLLLGMAMFFGSRRLPQRTIIFKFLMAAIFFLSLALTGAALVPVIGFSPLWFLIPMPVFTVVVILLAYKLVRDPRLPAEATPDDRWYGGLIYYNPDDPALFVQKRLGFGYTLNFGNRLTWLLPAAIVAIVVGLRAVLG